MFKSGIGLSTFFIFFFPLEDLLFKSFPMLIVFSRGDLDESAKCFQELVLKDQNHPAALINYAALLLCKYGSAIAGTL